MMYAQITNCWYFSMHNNEISIIYSSHVYCDCVKHQFNKVNLYDTEYSLVVNTLSSSQHSHYLADCRCLYFARSLKGGMQLEVRSVCIIILFYDKCVYFQY